jgi:hypothetical protein
MKFGVVDRVVPDVTVHAIPRMLAVHAGVIWLALAFPLILLAAFAVLVGSQSAVLFATMAAAALAVATALLANPSGRTPILASVVLGVVFAVVAVFASLRSAGVFPSGEHILVFGAFAASVALISAIAASRVVRT